MPDPCFHRYLEEINATPLLSVEEERLLFRELHNDKAGKVRVRERFARRRPIRDHLIRANLRLVVNIARQFQGRGLPIAEIVSAGNLGLIRAVRKFDVSRGVRFSTYACWWIKQFVRFALKDPGFVHVPAHAFDLAKQWEKASNELETMLGREPTEQEVAGRMKESRPRKLNMIRCARAGLLSRCGDDGFETALDLEPDRGSRLERLGLDAEDFDELDKALRRLTRRDRLVIGMRFGLTDGRPYGLREIGEHLGLTRERIRQIQERALLKLRAWMTDNSATDAA